MNRVLQPYELEEVLAARPASTRFDPLAYDFVDQVIRDKGFV